MVNFKKPNGVIDGAEPIMSSTPAQINNYVGTEAEELT